MSRFLKKIAILIVLVSIVGSIYLFQPHIEFKEVRISTKPVEIEAIYVNLTGEPLCAKLYVVNHMGNKPAASKEPLFLAMPKDIPSPNDGYLAHSENRFILKGYLYQFVKTNKLTNSLEEIPSHRFDVVSWKVISPYHKWRPETDRIGEVRQSQITSDPVSYKLNSSDHNSDYFIKRNYVDCLH